MELVNKIVLGNELLAAFIVLMCFYLYLLPARSDIFRYREIGETIGVAFFTLSVIITIHMLKVTIVGILSMVVVIIMLVSLGEEWKNFFLNNTIVGKKILHWKKTHPSF